MYHSLTGKSCLLLWSSYYMYAQSGTPVSWIQSMIRTAIQSLTPIVQAFIACHLDWCNSLLYDEPAKEGSQWRMLLIVFSPAHADVTTSHRCCVSYTGCQSRNKWNSTLRVLYTSRFICINLPDCWHSSRLRVWSSPPTLVYWWDTNSSTNPQHIWWQKLCCCGTSPVEQFAKKSATAMDSLALIWKLIYLGFEKSQCSVTYDFVCVYRYSYSYLNAPIGGSTYSYSKRCALNMDYLHTWCQQQNKKIVWSYHSQIQILLTILATYWMKPMCHWPNPTCQQSAAYFCTD